MDNASPPPAISGAVDVVVKYDLGHPVSKHDSILLGSRPWIVASRFALRPDDQDRSASKGKRVILVNANNKTNA
jgi:hypothetical protein